MLQRFKAFCIRQAMWIFLFVVAAICSGIVADNMQQETWRYTVYMDGRGYYAQLPAFFIYDDPSCAFLPTQSAIPGERPDFVNTVDGKPVNKYFCGEAFVQIPFFGAAHLIAKISGHDANGYSKPYFYCLAIGALFYFLLGLFFLWKLLENFLFRKRVILFVCFCFAAGTNLFHYAVYEPSMSHVYSFAMVTGFLYFTRCFFLSPSRKYLLLAAATLGIITLLRPVNLVMVFAFPVMAGNWENVKAGFRWLGKNIIPAILAILVFLAICFVQLYVYHWETGRFFVWSYGDEGFNFSDSHFYGTLFSYEKGLFLYMPFLLLAFFGLIVMARRSLLMSGTWLVVMAALAWIVSSWHEWRYGYSFGARAYIDYYALFALPIAFLLDYAFKRKIILAPAAVVTALLLALYGVQEIQYLRRILHPGAMNKEMYWLIFLKTDKKYQDTVTFINQALESDGGFNNMEGDTVWQGSETIVEGIAFSGKHSSRLDSLHPYSCTFVSNMGMYFVYGHVSRLVVTAYVLRNDTSDQADFGVAQVKDDRTHFLQYYPLPPLKKKGEWEQVRYELMLPAEHEDNESLKVFFHCKNGVVYIDDFDVQVRGR